MIILMAKWAIPKDSNISAINWYIRMKWLCMRHTLNQISITLPLSDLAEIMIIKFICGTSSNLDGEREIEREKKMNPFFGPEQMTANVRIAADLVVLSHYMMSKWNDDNENWVHINVNNVSQQHTVSARNEPQLTGLYLALSLVRSFHLRVHCVLFYYKLK